MIKSIGTPPGCDHIAVEGTSSPAPAAPAARHQPSMLAVPGGGAGGLLAANRAGQPLAGRGTGWEEAGGLRRPGGAFPTGL